MQFDGEAQRWREEAIIGERMSEFKNSPGYSAFKANVLDKIRSDAFELFADVPAEDTTAVTGAQQMKKVVDRVEKMVDALVEQGRLAREYLSNSNPEDGDE